MLVLTRKKGQSVMIGEDIEITVADIQGDQIRLAIKAPRNVAIHRKEIFLEIREENARAAEVKAVPLGDLLKNSKKP